MANVNPDQLERLNSSIRGFQHKSQELMGNSLQTIMRFDEEVKREISKWEKEKAVREKKERSAQNELRQCLERARANDSGRPANLCAHKQRAYDDARMKKRKAEEKLTNLRRIKSRVDVQLNEFNKVSASLKDINNNSIPKATNTVNRQVKELRKYQRIAGVLTTITAVQMLLNIAGPFMGTDMFTYTPEDEFGHFQEEMHQERFEKAIRDGEVETFSRHGKSERIVDD